MASKLTLHRRIVTVRTKTVTKGFTLEYDDEYPLLLMDHGGYGNDPSTFAAELHIPLYLIDEWRASYPDFNEAYKICWMKVISFWENKLTESAETDQKLMMDAAKFRLNQVYHRVNLLDKDPLYSPKRNTKEAVGDVDLAKDLQNQINKQE